MRIDKVETNGEKLGKFIGYTSLFLSVVAMPLCTIYMIVVRKRVFKHRHFKRKYGYLFENLNVKSRYKRLYPFVFLLRRAIFITTCFVLAKFPGNQI
jgi:hypothetical protein